MAKLTGKYHIYPLSSYLEGSKKCLSIAGNSSEACANIIVSDYHKGNSSQVFTFEEIGNKYKVVTSYHKQVFDVKEYRMLSGSPIIQYPDNGGRNQHWDIIKADKQLLNPILMMLKIDANSLTDAIYNISILGFHLTILNDQAIIDKDSQELYILEEVK